MNQKNEALASSELNQGRKRNTQEIIPSTLPDTPGIDKYKMYECHKKYLQAAGLNPWEYEIEVRRLVERLGI